MAQGDAPQRNRGLKARYIWPVGTRYIALSALDPWLDSYLGLQHSASKKTLAECFHPRLVYTAPLGLVPVAVCPRAPLSLLC